MAPLGTPPRRCRTGGSVHKAHRWRDDGGGTWQCPGWDRCGRCLRQRWTDLLGRVPGTGQVRCRVGGCADGGVN